jgi:hypothetical protein
MISLNIPAELRDYFRFSSLILQVVYPTIQKSFLAVFVGLLPQESQGI